MARGYPDFEGAKSGLYLMPEWAAKEATDKNFYGFAVNQPGGQSVLVEYTVPADKTLYITQMSAATFPSAGTNIELVSISDMRIYDATALQNLWVQGISVGGGIVFPKPIVCPSAHLIQMRNFNWSANNKDLFIVVGGYEI